MNNFNLAASIDQLQHKADIAVNSPDESVYRLGVVAKMMVYGSVLVEGPDVDANGQLLQSVERFIDGCQVFSSVGLRTLTIEGGGDKTLEELDEVSMELERFAEECGPKTLMVDQIDNLMNMTGDEEIDSRKLKLVNSIAGYALSDSTMMSMIASAKKPLAVKNRDGSEIKPEQATIMGMFAHPGRRYQFNGFDKGRKRAVRTLNQDRLDLFYNANVGRLRRSLSKMSGLAV